MDKTKGILSFTVRKSHLAAGNNVPGNYQETPRIAKQERKPRDKIGGPLDLHSCDKRDRIPSGDTRTEIGIVGMSLKMLATEATENTEEEIVYGLFSEASVSSVANYKSELLFT